MTQPQPQQTKWYDVSEDHLNAILDSHPPQNIRIMINLIRSNNACPHTHQQQGGERR